MNFKQQSMGLVYIRFDSIFLQEDAGRKLRICLCKEIELAVLRLVVIHEDSSSCNSLVWRVVRG